MSMVTKEQIETLEQQAEAYAAASGKINFAIENRQEELTGILRAYEAANDISAQVLRQYFLNGGLEND
jgi:hypothetical protein